MLIIEDDGYYMGGKRLSDEFHREAAKLDQETSAGMEALYQLALKEGRKTNPNFRFMTGLELFRRG